MSTAPVNEKPEGDRSSGRVEKVKIIVLVAVALTLFFFGFRGRQQVFRDLRIAEVVAVRNQLQQGLEEQQRLIERPTSTNAAPTPILRTAELEATVNSLKALLSKIQNEENELEIRLGKATLANAEGRFSDALLLVNEADETGKAGRGSKETQAASLQIRGDAFYGLRRWDEASSCYRRLLESQPQRIAARQRLGDCLYAIGKADESTAAYVEAAQRRTQRAGHFLNIGEPLVAAMQYEKAIELYARSVEQNPRVELTAELARAYQSLGAAYLAGRRLDLSLKQFDKGVELGNDLVKKGRSDWVNELALCHFNRGNVFFTQGKAANATTAYLTAIEIIGQVVNEAERTEFEPELALSYAQLGNAYLAQAKSALASEQFEKAIAIQDRLFKQGQTAVSLDRAMTINNRGVVRRIEGNLDAATSDFELTIGVLKGLGEAPKGRQPGVEKSGAGLVKLDLPIIYNERGLDVLPRTRAGEDAEARTRDVALAMSLKNRAYVYEVRGRFDGAIDDLNAATEIFARLVKFESQEDMAGQLGKTLASLAWIYATAPNDSARNGGKALELSRKACELTGWKLSFAIETLAAACAESRQFAEAIQWQEKAIEHAPREQKMGLQARLQLFKGEKAYRMEVKQ